VFLGRDGRLDPNGQPRLDGRVVAALLLFTFNPIWLYWSLRIYADVFFGTIVMLAFLIWYRIRETSTNNRTLWLSLLGIVTGLSVMTRFEGYFLGQALL